MKTPEMIAADKRFRLSYRLRGNGMHESVREFDAMAHTRFSFLLILFLLDVARVHAETPEEETSQLIREFKSADAELRDTIAKRIRAIGLEGREAIPLLLQAEAESEYGIGSWYGHDLGAEPVPSLCRIIRESGGKNRELAIWSLSSLEHDAAIAVPLLIELMNRKDEQPSVRVAAIKAAVRIGRHVDPVVTVLSELLSEENRQVASSAADALGDLGLRAKSAGPAMAKAALEHSDPYVRQRCILFLADVESDRRRVATTLAAALSDKGRTGGFAFSSELYEEAIEELTALGPDAAPAIPAMLELLRTDKIRETHWVYGYLTTALAGCGPAAKQAIPLLRVDIRPKEKRNLPPPHPILGSFGEWQPKDGEFSLSRVLAAKALIRLAPDDDDAFSTLMEIFADGQWGNGYESFGQFGAPMNPRQEAAAGFGYCHKQRDQVIALLRKALAEDGTSDFRETCAWSLARLGADDVKLPLREFQLYLYPGLRPAVYARLLGKDVRAYVPALIDLALSYERERSTYFFQVVMQLKEDYSELLAKHATKKLIAGEDFGREEEVLVALGERSMIAIPLLLDAIKNGDWRIRAQACRVLGLMKLQPETVLPALAASVRDARPLVRARAVEALGRFGRQVRIHIDAIEAARAEKYLTVQLAACYAARSIRSKANPRQLPKGFDPLNDDKLAARLDIKRFQQIAARRQAWDESLIALAKPKTNRRAIAKKMKELIRIESTLQTETNLNFVPLLEATVAPSQAKPGSIEAAIDAFVEVTDESVEDDPRVFKIIDHGFDAVPLLIKHFDDPRLTRCGDSILHDDTLGFVPVGDIVRETLGLMIGQTFTFQEVESAKKWWDDARPLGEAKYLQRAVAERAIRGDYVGDGLWYLAERRVPRKLADAYQRVLKDGFHRSRPLAKAIGRSTLDKTVKIEALLKGAAHKEHDHRWVALGQLLNLDEETFRQRAIDEIDKLPLRAETLADLINAGRATYELANTRDERIWNHFTRHVKRADVVLRIEYVDSVLGYEINERSLDRRIEFAVALLDDKEVRTVGRNARVENPTFRRIEVRNIAAWNLAYLIGMEVEPEEDWTAEQWSALRAHVVQAHKQHNNPARP
jgi:HEAT repeat protein